MPNTVAWAHGNQRAGEQDNDVMTAFEIFDRWHIWQWCVWTSPLNTKVLRDATSAHGSAGCINDEIKYPSQQEQEYISTYNRTLTPDGGMTCYKGSVECADEEHDKGKVVPKPMLNPNPTIIHCCRSLQSPQSMLFFILFCVASVLQSS
jgi:hypothetical protein